MSTVTYQLHPSSVVNDDHKGALITITVAFGLSCSLLVLLCRLLVRWPWSKVFGYDDGSIVLATIFALAQAIVTFIAVNNGLGTRPDLLSDEMSLIIAKEVYIGNLFFILSLFTGKFSVLFLFKRLIASRPQMIPVHGLFGACAGFWLVSFLLVAVAQGDTSAPWLGMNTSTSFDSWIAVETMSLLLEVGIAVFAIWFLKGLQMQMDTKTELMLGFCLRLLAIPVAALRLLSITRAHSDSADLFKQVMPLILLYVETSYNLISATVPSLKLGLKKAYSGMLGQIPTGTLGGSQLGGSGSGSKSYPGMAKSRSRTGRSESNHPIHIRTDIKVTSAQVADRADQNSLDSDSSRRAIVPDASVGPNAYQATVHR